MYRGGGALVKEIFLKNTNFFDTFPKGRFPEKKVAVLLDFVQITPKTPPRTSGGTFGPLKSDLGVFWPFRATDFIMGTLKI